MRRLWPVQPVLIGMLLFSIISPVMALPAWQSPFQGQIISPQPSSEPLRGSVEIVGIATHPDFWKYDLYAVTGRAQDPWYPIATGIEQRVDSPARLAVWDTTQVPDDEYILVLRIWDRSEGLQDFQFARYAVENARPPDTATPAPTATQPLPTVPPQTPTVVIEQPPTLTPAPSPTPGGPATATPTAQASVLTTLNTSGWRDAFCRGAWLTALIFALWGIVWLLRQGLRWVLKRQRGRQLLPPR